MNKVTWHRVIFTEKDASYCCILQIYFAILFGCTVYCIPWNVFFYNLIHLLRDKVLVHYNNLHNRKSWSHKIHEVEGEKGCNSICQKYVTLHPQRLDAVIQTKLVYLKLFSIFPTSVRLSMISWRAESLTLVCITDATVSGVDENVPVIDAGRRNRSATWIFGFRLARVVCFHGNCNIVKTVRLWRTIHIF